MALKAYKHLTDGEVKLVEADSAEEAGLVADVVHGASYIQLQTDGSGQEVAAAQGDALWEDVTGELGGGGSAFAHLTEDTDNSEIVFDFPLTAGGGGPTTRRLTFDPTTGNVLFGSGLGEPDLTLRRDNLHSAQFLGNGPTSLRVTNAMTGDGWSLSSTVSDFYSPNAAGTAATLRLWSDHGNGDVPEITFRTDGSIALSNGTDPADCILARDVDGDLTVNGTKVQLVA